MGAKLRIEITPGLDERDIRQIVTDGAARLAAQTGTLAESITWTVRRDPASGTVTAVLAAPDVEQEMAALRHSFAVMGDTFAGLGSAPVRTSQYVEAEVAAERRRKREAERALTDMERHLDQVEARPQCGRTCRTTPCAACPERDRQPVEQSTARGPLALRAHLWWMRRRLWWMRIRLEGGVFTTVKDALTAPLLLASGVLLCEVTSPPWWGFIGSFFLLLAGFQQEHSRWWTTPHISKVISEAEVRPGGVVKGGWPAIVGNERAWSRRII